MNTTMSVWEIVKSKIDSVATAARVAAAVDDIVIYNDIMIEGCALELIKNRLDENESTNEVFSRFEEIVNLAKRGEKAHYASTKNEGSDIGAVILLETGDTCVILKNTVQCLNRTYIRDDKIIISECSVAGNVDTRESVISGLRDYQSEILTIRLKEDISSYGRLIVGYWINS